MDLLKQVLNTVKPCGRHTANRYSHSTAFVQSKGCNANLITAIDSALSLTVLYYSQATASLQLITTLIAELDCNWLSCERHYKIPLMAVIGWQEVMNGIKYSNKLYILHPNIFWGAISLSLKSKQKSWQWILVWLKVKTTQTLIRIKILYQFWILNWLQRSREGLFCQQINQEKAPTLYE